MAEPIRVSRGGVYVPLWGNADRGDSDRITVHYRFLSIGDEQSIVSRANRGLPEGLSDDERLAEAIGRQWIARVAAMIESIENLSIDDGEGVKEITTGDELFAEPALVELGYELIHEMKGLTAVDKKKLPSESSSGRKDKRTRTSEKRSETEGSA